MMILTNAELAGHIALILGILMLAIITVLDQRKP